MTIPIFDEAYVSHIPQDLRDEIRDIIKTQGYLANPQARLLDAMFQMFPLQKTEKVKKK